MDELRTASKKIEDLCDTSTDSKFYRYGGVGYKSSASHYFQSSSDAAYSAVEPGSTRDLIEIMKILKEHDTVPFAIKSGGHATNSKFSSTTGIQISMVRFNRIKYAVNGNPGTVAIGAGCIFDEVYNDEALSTAEQNIVGVTEFDGVGIAGWLLGGGYSTLKTNQHGLGSDNVLSYTIVVPNDRNTDPVVKTVVKRTGNQPPTDEERLFWALQGGGNNFGIVTEFTLKTHPQAASIYSGTLVYDTGEIESVKKAMLSFLEKRNRMDTIKAVFRYDNTPRGIQFRLLLFCYHDAELADGDPGPFKEFLDIDHTGELKNRKFWELQGIPLKSLTSTGENVRGRWGCVMLGKYDKKILDLVDKLAEKRAKGMADYNGRMFAIGCKPFLEEMFDGISTEYFDNGAWPHKKGEANHPLLVYAEWEDEKNDTFWISEMQRTIKVLSRNITPSEAGLPVYSNTALAEHTATKEIYCGHLGELEAIRGIYDPQGLMSRAGGFKISS